MTRKVTTRDHPGRGRPLELGRRRYPAAKKEGGRELLILDGFWGATEGNVHFQVVTPTFSVKCFWLKSCVSLGEWRKDCVFLLCLGPEESVVSMEKWL